MARIRSIHPGLWTDGVFMDLSDAAQLLWIGLWTEADDQGVFAWQQSTLKARLRPNASPIGPALEELMQADCIRSYELDGRKYGAVRNFCRFQRPKKPSHVYPVPHQFRTYLGLSGDGSEPPAIEDRPVLPKAEPEPPEAIPIPPKAEMSPQMEEGGDKGRREEIKGGGVSKTRGRANGTHQPQGKETLLPENWFPDDDADEAVSAKLGDRTAAFYAKFVSYNRAHAVHRADWNAEYLYWAETENKPPN
jgi:hypothetical protein